MTGWTLTEAADILASVGADRDAAVLNLQDSRVDGSTVAYEGVSFVYDGDDTWIRPVNPEDLSRCRQTDACLCAECMAFKYGNQ